VITNLEQTRALVRRGNGDRCFCIWPHAH